MDEYLVRVTATLTMTTRVLQSDTEEFPGKDQVKIWLEDDLKGWEIHKANLSALDVVLVDD